MFDWLNNLFDRLMAPVAEWPAEASCAVLSVLIGALLLVFFKYVSMQSQIELVKNRMTACVLGVWLFRREPGMIFRCQAGALGHGMHYLGLNLLPLAVMALPMMLILSQMNAYLSYRPVPQGAEVLVTATLSPAATGEKNVQLKVPAGTTIRATHADPGGRQFAWRIACVETTKAPLEVVVGGTSFEKSLVVDGGSVVRADPARSQGGFWHRLLYPSDAPLPDGGPLESISISYPARDLKLLVWPMHWLYSCFVVMLVAVLLLRKPMGVAI